MVFKVLKNLAADGTGDIFKNNKNLYFQEYTFS